MWGAPRELWSPRLFHEVLPAQVRAHCPGVAYWPSSAHGGAFPHQASSGSTSYYGVGAYLRPLDDARRSELRFASESLAFANVPAPAALPGGPGARVHTPAWKARTPRDLGAGWDFDDVRDHYLGLLFGVDPLELRFRNYAETDPQSNKPYSSKYLKEAYQLGADAIYATNENRGCCTKNNIATSFIAKGNEGKLKDQKSQMRSILGKIRSTVLEGSFGNEKNHYQMNKIKAKTEGNERVWIFFSLLTCNAMQIAKRIQAVKKAGKQLQTAA